MVNTGLRSNGGIRIRRGYQDSKLSFSSYIRILREAGNVEDMIVVERVKHFVMCDLVYRVDGFTVHNWAEGTLHEFTCRFAFCPHVSCSPLGSQIQQLSTA